MCSLSSSAVGSSENVPKLEEIGHGAQPPLTVMESTSRESGEYVEMGVLDVREIRGALQQQLQQQQHLQ